MKVWAGLRYSQETTPVRRYDALDDATQLDLVSNIESGDPDVRDALARTLSGLQLNDASQLALVSNIEFGDPEVRRAAARALGRSNPSNSSDRRLVRTS